VQNCDAFHDCKPETRAAAVPGTSSVHAVKPVEDAREMLSRNATPVVRHGNKKSSIITRGFQADVPANARVGKRVFDKVPDGSLEQGAIHGRSQSGRRGEIKADARVACGGLIELPHGHEFVTDIDRLAADLRLGMFGAGKEQKAVDRAGQTEALLEEPSPTPRGTRLAIAPC
jgi:hypothetical protein